MEEYPKTLREFESSFSSESACRDFLFRLRWPDGFICPRCDAHGGWLAKSGRIVCSRCRLGTTVTAGTIFQDSHQPLTAWFRAMWWMTNQKSGLSGLGLQRLLGLGSYRTAWMMLHKLRSAMVRPGRDRLSNTVEVDETYFGGVEKGVRGRQTKKKSIIVVAAQEDGLGIGRIRMSQIDDASAASLHGFVNATVELGSTIRTDDWTGYQGLGAKGYRHEVIPIKRSGKQAHELLPRVHKVISLFKRWMLGTHQGATSHEHLASYLNEFVFRFNRRTSVHRGKLFLRLAQQAVAVEPVTYVSLIKGVREARACKHKVLG